MFTERAPVAWKYLNGIVCVYKPAFCTMGHVRRVFLFKLCNDLNKMECRGLRKFVNIVGSTTQPMTVKVQPNLADHPLVAGPRYIEKDFRFSFVNKLGVRTSGIQVIGLNRGTKFAEELKETKPLKVYHVKAQLGLLTNTLFSDGKPKYKCNYDFLTNDAIDRVVASVQAAHQKNLYHLTGVDLKSQEAYEMATSGLVRPILSDAPVIYNIKCIDVNLPEITLEITAVNENEDYFLRLVYEIGYQLKNVASTVSIRCIRVGFFTLEYALLKKHWTLENVLENLKQCYNIIQQSEKMDQNLQKIDDNVIKSFRQEQNIDVEVVDESIVN